jgi:RNA polymerase sigma-70 factor (ECF subfamily)
MVHRATVVETPAMPWGLPISASDVHFVQAKPRERAEAIAQREPTMDEAAFARFYAETSRPLFGYLLRVTGDRALAEDLLQEAYCRLLSADRPDMNHSQSKSYLFRIATNLLHDRWRHHKEDSRPIQMPEAAACTPHLDLKLGVRQAFRQLKPRERELLWLAYVEGSNHKEIADCTGLRASSVRLLLFRARRKLASLIRIGG